MLSAHMGNWELGAMVLGKMGYPILAVILSHQEKNVNEFFRHQRMRTGVEPIEIGISLRACYKALKENKLLALLGDRDFSGSGILTEFFGHKAVMPKGPAVFSMRTGSAIVPVFMIRNDDDTFSFNFDSPIYPEEFEQGDKGFSDIMRKTLDVLEKHIRMHADQWYVFRNIWVK